MRIVGPTHLNGPQGLQGPHAARSGNQTTQSGSVKSSAGDQLDISAAAQAAIDAADAKSSGGVRTELVSRIRDEIQNGTYETEDKIDAALDRLLDQLG